MRLHKLVIVALLVGISLSSCGSGNSQSEVLLVPEKYPTIQAAVDKAKDGDLVLISPGNHRWR
jgi:hypothetical protein